MRYFRTVFGAAAWRCHFVMRQLSSFAARAVLAFLFCVVLGGAARAQTITTVAGTNTEGYNGDSGVATQVRLAFANGVAVDGAGDLFIADQNNHRIRKVTPDGNLTTIAGNGTKGFSGDGGPGTAAQLNQPAGVALDSAGNLLIADSQNSCIRKLTPGGIISTIAGTGGTYGLSGDGGQATKALLYFPQGLAVDSADNIFVADTYSQRIRKITPDGKINTVAGGSTSGAPGFSGDGGPATKADLNFPYTVAVDGAGDLFIGDNGNARVRKVDTKGIISTVAGNGTDGDTPDGDGGPATKGMFYRLYGVAVDGAGNLYIADFYHSRVRKVDTSGIITTFAGNGSPGVSGDGGPAIKAQLEDPLGLTFDSAGNLYIGDSITVRKVGNGAIVAPTPTPAPTASGSFSATGSMANKRYSQTATLLTNGQVLVTGGGGPIGSQTSAELYDPKTGTFSATPGAMNDARRGHTATLLNNGQVLFVGGQGPSTTLASAELYNPATSTFTFTGSMATARVPNSATLLQNGKVLVVGGNDSKGNTFASAELYDPATGTFSATGAMPTPRAYSTATLLPSGQVLITGGSDAGGATLSSALLYDPASGQFAATGNLNQGRYYHTATLLGNGKVLIAGGFTASAELYDPATGTFSTTSNLNTSRGRHTATLLASGQVLIAGGSVPGNAKLASAELYDPATGTFSATGSLITARDQHTATLLPNGQVLITGGFGAGDATLQSAELYGSGPAVTPTPTPGPVATSGALISQFRFNGPNGASDQFVELANATSYPLNVTGWNLKAAVGSAAPTVTIPITGVIPARGHLLLTDAGSGKGKTGGYSLGVPGDITYTTDIPQGNALTLSNASGVTVDSVGSLRAPPVFTDQYAFVRRLDSGAPSTDSASFNLVDTVSTYSTSDRSGVGSFNVGPQGNGRLGSPNPHNTNSTVQRNAQIGNAPLNVQGVSSVARYASKGSGVDTKGRLSIRRTITNNTGAAVSKLRFRVVAITAGASTTSGVADLRAISSVGAKNPVSLQFVTSGLTLDAPTTPTEAPLTASSSGRGGGLNSSWTAPLPGGSLASGASVNVEFLFGIHSEGNFRVVVDAELLP